MITVTGCSCLIGYWISEGPGFNPQPDYVLTSNLTYCPICTTDGMPSGEKFYSAAELSPTTSHVFQDLVYLLGIIRMATDEI